MTFSFLFFTSFGGRDATSGQVYNAAFRVHPSAHPAGLYCGLIIPLREKSNIRCEQVLFCRYDNRYVSVLAQSSVKCREHVAIYLWGGTVAVAIDDWACMNALAGLLCGKFCALRAKLANNAPIIEWGKLITPHSLNLQPDALQVLLEFLFHTRINYV